MTDRSGGVGQLPQAWRTRADDIIDDVNHGHAPLHECDRAHGWQDCADELESRLIDLRASLEGLEQEITSKALGLNPLDPFQEGDLGKWADQLAQVAARLHPETRQG